MTDWLPALWLAPGVWLAWRQRGYADKPVQHLVPLLLGPVIYLGAGALVVWFWITPSGRAFVRAGKGRGKG